MRIGSPPAVGSTRSSRALRALVLAALLGAAGFAGWHQIFATHTDYDDEGYVMLSIVSFMDGKPLYDETYTQYGPVPFVVASAVHGLTGLPIDHDVTRLTTLGLWLAAAVLAAALVVRLTGAWWAGAVAFLVAFFHLERLCLEPGHPQQLCVLGILAAPLMLSGRAALSHRGAAVLGFLVASVAMTKPNVGGFLLASTGLALLVLGTRDRVARLALTVAVPAVLLLPFVLTRAHLRAPSGMVLPMVVTFSTLATVVVALRERGAPIVGWGHLAAFAGSVVAAVVAWGAAAVWHGTSLAGLRHGLTDVHAGFITAFASPVPLHATAMLWAMAGVLLALAVHRHPCLADVARPATAIALVVSCLRYLLETFTPLIHGLDDRGAAGALLGIATPVLWVLLVPGRRLDPGLAPRLLLCLVACFQPLGAYPTPGTQMAIGTVAVALGCVVALDDQLRIHRATWWQVSIASLAALLALTLVARDVHFRTRWTELARLRLPGARWVRMERRDAARYRWLARTLRARTDTFVFAEHARDSFYFWTRLPPPTALNPTFWPFMLGQAEQERVVAALGRAGRVGVVHESPGATQPDDSPLRAYLAARFRPVLTDGHFHVWLPRASPPSRRAP